MKLTIYLFLAACGLAPVSVHAGESPRTLSHEAIIHAPVSDVWDAFTTEQGIEAWMLPHAEIDLRVGGEWRTNYQPDGKIGDANTITHQILAFEPQRMLATKNVGCPQDFPFKDAIADLWSVMYFEPVGIDRTRIRIVGIGYDDTEESQQLYNFFKQGNAIVLNMLEAHFAPEGASAKGAYEHGPLGPMHRFADAQWIVEGAWNSGDALKARSIMQWGLDGKVIKATTIVDDPARGGEYTRYETIYRWDAAANEIRGTTFAYDGSVSHSRVTVVDESTLRFESANSEQTDKAGISETIEFIDDDSYTWTVTRNGPDGPQQLIEATWNKSSTIDG